MGTTPPQVLAFPNIRAIVRDNGTAEVLVAGNSRIVPAGDSVQELRNNALALIVGEAQTLQRPVRVKIEDPEGHGELIVHPDNRIESVSYDPRPARRRAQAPDTTPRTAVPAIIETVPAPVTTPVEPAPVPAPAVPVDARPGPPAPVAVADAADTAPAPATPEPQTAAAAPEEVAPTRRSLKDTSFLVSAPVLEPATQGWRGTLTRLGLRMDPSAEELSERRGHPHGQPALARPPDHRGGEPQGRGEQDPDRGDALGDPRPLQRRGHRGVG